MPHWKYIYYLNLVFCCNLGSCYLISSHQCPVQRCVALVMITHRSWGPQCKKEPKMKSITAWLFGKTPSGLRETQQWYQTSSLLHKFETNDSHDMSKCDQQSDFFRIASLLAENLKEPDQAAIVTAEQNWWLRHIGLSSEVMQSKRLLSVPQGTKNLKRWTWLGLEPMSTGSRTTSRPSCRSNPKEH